MCKDFEDFMKWYQDIVEPKTEEFRKHVSTCEECRNWLLSQKDGMALSLLMMSEQALIDRLGKGKGVDEA